MASFSVLTNVGALNATSNLQSTDIGLQRSLTRLSSGLRINRSGDDAAGLAVANGYRSDTAILNQGIRNANDGLSTLSTQDSALDNISTLLDRLGTLASQSASGGTTATSRTTLNAEFQDILGEITREAAVAGIDSAQGFSVFVSNNGANGVVSGSINAITTTTLTVASLDISTQTGATAAVTAIDAGVDVLGTAQGQVGSLQNQLEFGISLAKAQSTNNQAAESRIRDADIAVEAANLSKFSILNQSGIAALAQANSSTASLLSLLN